MYDAGDGVPKDKTEAVKWYRMVAERGHAQAQYNLGSMYVDGQGVPQDIVTAYAWWDVSAAQGDEDAVKNRDIAAKDMMTPSQLEKGQELSREYFKQYVK